MKNAYTCLVLVAVILRQGALTVTTEKKQNHQNVTLEDETTVSKRQTQFKNSNFNSQQIPQNYLDFIPQSNAGDSLMSQQPQFGQQNVQQIFVPLPSDVFSQKTTTTLSPFSAEQVRLQEEYARRLLVDQQTALIRPRQRPFTQSQIQVQPLSVNQQQQPLRFIDKNGQVRQLQNFEPEQLDFILQQQQQLQFAPPQQQFAPQQQEFTPQQQQQQEFAPQQQIAIATQSGEPFSYAQIHFGSGSGLIETVMNRPKGQRSVSRPNINHVMEPTSQPTINYPSTTVTPSQLNSRLLKDAVYIQPNGQMYKPIEDLESVVQIPRRNYYYYQQSSIISNSDGSVSPTVSYLPMTTTTASPVEEEQVILIPQPKKSSQRPRQQDSRKPVRAQLRTEKPQLQQQQLLQQQQQQEQLFQQQLQQSSEVEPDPFVMSLLSQYQEQPHNQETTITSVPKTKTGQRSKGGNRSELSKYLPDRNQLQLLQFPDELKSLSNGELRALTEANAQIAALNGKSVAQKQLYRNKPVTTTAPPSLLPSTERPVFHSRPVPQPVELNEQQRQFLSSQGIRHLYRVDYDQNGNALPLTYVLALDNRPKRNEEQQQQQKQQ